MESTFAKIAVVFYVLELLAGLFSRSGKPEARFPLLFLVAFLCNVIAFASRWAHCGYPPFSNLHEVMLLLTTVSFPVYLYYRRNGEGNGFLRGTICGGAAIYLVYPAFISDGLPRPLMPALQSDWFIPHVSAYMASYFMLTVAGLLALRELVRETPGGLRTADRIARHAFFFLTFGLVSGAAWAQEAWGTYWGWDPKEVWSLVSWLIYLYYFHYRLKPGNGRRTQAALLVLGLAAVLVTFFIVNLSRIFAGMHSYSSM